MLWWGSYSAAFGRVLYLVVDVCDRVWRGLGWLRPAVGGLLLGGLLTAVPPLYGVGYPAIRNTVDGRYLTGCLVVLLLAKILATSLTLGIGGSGGVFGPVMFIGAMGGTTAGALVHGWLPSLTNGPAVFGSSA